MFGAIAFLIWSWCFYKYFHILQILFTLFYGNAIVQYGLQFYLIIFAI